MGGGGGWEFTEASLLRAGAGGVLGERTFPPLVFAGSALEYDELRPYASDAHSRSRARKRDVNLGGALGSKGVSVHTAKRGCTLETEVAASCCGGLSTFFGETSA
jgi:hypothetical protein